MSTLPLWSNSNLTQKGDKLIKLAEQNEVTPRRDKSAIQNEVTPGSNKSVIQNEVIHRSDKSAVQNDVTP